jgi:7-cyano-7-deazaguanine synthase
MSKAVVLYSGGMDSTTLLERAIEDGNDQILALSVQYGSLHNEAEGEAAKQIVHWYQLAIGDELLKSMVHEVVQIPAAIFKGEASALLGEIPMPKITYEEIREGVGPSPTVVPFRNANLISIATAVAHARNYDFVYIGAHAEDAHNWAYPDCTPEFLGAMANAVYIGTYDKVRLRFPFIWLEKYQIVSYAAETGAPIEMSWSCYSPKVVDDGDKIHCGECPTCIERANAFAQAGFLDPTAYFVAIEKILDDNYITEELEEWPNG